MTRLAARWVYPRACGGTEGWFERHPSPDPGSIPARAGEPQNAGHRLHRDQVYPRACGGTKWLHSSLRWNYEGSIPARAGEPLVHNASRVYPRACGGTAGFGGTVDGLSPRVRGNQPGPSPVNREGLSPRVRGNRQPSPKRRGRRWVYPRACGGTPPCSGRTIPARAGEPVPFCRLRGSIPARAGEPHNVRVPQKMNTVYPRACGGTPEGSGAVAAHVGSIPARAGEPMHI